MKKECVQCGDEFSGRADARFCSSYCRSAYHNKTTEIDHTLVRKVNYTLKKNLKILSELNPGDKKRVKKDDLIGKGYDFNFHTNVYQTKGGRSYYFCYNKGYYDSEDGWLTLVTKLDFV